MARWRKIANAFSGTSLTEGWPAEVFVALPITFSPPRAIFV
jgi:hypothetical protein